jgi:hypothetical protein
MGDDLRDFILELREEARFNFTGDVTPYLGSPVTYALFESEPGEKPYSQVLRAPLEQRHDLDDVLEDLSRTLARNELQVDADVEGPAIWHVWATGRDVRGCGIAHEHLICACGRNRIRTLKREFASSAGSFLDAADAARAKTALRGDSTIALYWDVEAIADEDTDGWETDLDMAMTWPLIDASSEAFVTVEFEGQLLRVHGTLTAERTDEFVRAVLEVLEAGVAQ